MTIKVAPGTLSWMRKYPDQVTLQVKDAADHQAVMQALETAKNEITSTPGADIRFFHGPLPADTGAFFWFDAGSTAYSVLKAFPDIIAKHLQSKGISDATIVAARGGELWGVALKQTRRAVVLCAFPPPPETLDRRPKPTDRWFREAADWVTAGLAADTQIMAQVHTQQFYIPAGEGESLFKSAYDAAPGTCHLISGDFTSTIRAVNGRFTKGHMAFAAGGPAASDETLLEIFDRLVEVARRLATEKLSYAFISIEPGFSTFWNINHYTDWIRSAGGEQNMRYVWDKFAYDAFPYQILGPDHLKNLESKPPGSRTVGRDKTEVLIGKPSQWLLNRDEHVPPRPELGKRRKDPSIQDNGREMQQQAQQQLQAQVMAGMMTERQKQAEAAKQGLSDKTPTLPPPEDKPPPPSPRPSPSLRQ